MKKDRFNPRQPPKSQKSKEKPVLVPVTRTDRDTQTDNGTGHNMCHHLWKGVSQKEGDEGVKQSEQQKQGLHGGGFLERIRSVVPALIQEQNAEEQIERKRKVLLDRF